MSTAALASARRRRTTNETPVPPSQSVATKTTQQESPNASKQALPPPQSLTPLQILQIHDNKLKDLEALMVELNSEEYIANVVEEKINDLMQAKLATFSNSLDKVKASDHNFNSFESKLQILETTIQTNLTIQTVRFDEFKNGIQENFNNFKENTIRNIDLLIAKENNGVTPTISNTNLNVEKLDMLVKELNELKLLVIKNQTLALETCTSLINMKDEIKLHSEKMEQINDKLDSTNNMCCKEQQCDPAQMFLQSFMKTKLFGGANKINIDANYNDEGEEEEEEEYEDNSSINNNNNKKIHIDLINQEVILGDDEIFSNNGTIILDNNELIIDEGQLQNILEINAMEEINLQATTITTDDNTTSEL